jgi:hypothetical protein
MGFRVVNNSFKQLSPRTNFHGRFYFFITSADENFAGRQLFSNTQSALAFSWDGLNYHKISFAPVKRDALLSKVIVCSQPFSEGTLQREREDPSLRSG